MKTCKELLAKKDWVVLDTETTGLSDKAQVCQIGVLSHEGEVLMDTLVKPTVPITYGAVRVHGITPEMIKDAPGFMDIFPELLTILQNKFVVVYNAPFDKRLLEQTYQAHLDGRPDMAQFSEELGWIDVMIPYANYFKDWNPARQSNRWQSLENACRQQGVPVVESHSAIGDCRMTLALIRKLGDVQD